MNAHREGLHVLFHGVGRPERVLEPGEEDYWVEPPQFEEMLDALAPVTGLTISFDDSNASDLDVGLPALKRHGLTATFFVIAGRMGQRGSLDAHDVTALLGEGMTVGTHGMHHIPWRRLDADQVHEEFVVARRVLEDVTGGPIERAALPFGAYSRQTLQHLRRLGYHDVSTSDRRLPRRDDFLQHRFSVRRTDTPEGLLAEVTRASTMTHRARKAVAGVIKRWR